MSCQPRAAGTAADSGEQAWTRHASGSLSSGAPSPVEDLREIYPEKMHGDPDWNLLREYFCPGCKTLLEVEAVPPGYPIVHDFLPDLEGFYEDWLDRELPS